MKKVTKELKTVLAEKQVWRELFLVHILFVLPQEIISTVRVFALLYWKYPCNLFDNPMKDFLHHLLPGIHTHLTFSKTSLTSW